jgi:hypothetical protein
MKYKIIYPNFKIQQKKSRDKTGSAPVPQAWLRYKKPNSWKEI